MNQGVTTGQNSFPNAPQLGHGRAKLIVCFANASGPVRNSSKVIRWWQRKWGKVPSVESTPEVMEAPKTLPESDHMGITCKLSLLCDVVFFYKINFSLWRQVSRTTLSLFCCYHLLSSLVAFSSVEIRTWVEMSHHFVMWVPVMVTPISVLWDKCYELTR